MPLRRLVRLVPVLVLAACASSSGGGDPLVLAPGMLPVPYGVEELRAANQPGTVRVYRVVGSDGVPRIQTTTFTADEDGRATFEMTATLADGTPDGETRVEAGAFDCVTYERRIDQDGATEVHRFWFAKDDPGPPVLYVATREGAQIYRMELIDVRRPG